MLWHLVLFSACPICAALRTFTPAAFLIKRQIGQLGFATEVEWQYSRDGAAVAPNPLDPAQPKRTVEASGISVRLFDAALDDGTRILLKEFIGDARSIGKNEIDVYQLLYDNAKAAGRPPPSEVGQLLGTMRADSTYTSATFQAEWAQYLSTPPPSADGLWLAFAWGSGLRPVADFARQPQERSWLDFDGRQAAHARAIFIKATCARILQGVSWLHGQGIVHRSLGSSSLLLSTYDQRTMPGALSVQMIDLGFACTASRLTPDDVQSALSRGASSPLDVFPFLARADDLHALAYVLFELVLGATPPPPSPSAAGAEASPAESRPTDVHTLKRLIEDVFDGDVCCAFRDYCSEDAEWAPAVALLDEGEGRAGWRMMQTLVDCRNPNAPSVADVTAQSLLDSPWFRS